jgi:hypothetical protein
MESPFALFSHSSPSVVLFSSGVLLSYNNIAWKKSQNKDISRRIHPFLHSAELCWKGYRENKRDGSGKKREDVQ